MVDPCPVCDRATCTKGRNQHVQRDLPLFAGGYCGCVDDCPECAAERDCFANRVEWRTRALAAERDRDDMVAGWNHGVSEMKPELGRSESYKLWHGRGLELAKLDEKSNS